MGIGFIINSFMFKKRKNTPKDPPNATNNHHKRIPLLTIPSLTLHDNRRTHTLPSGQPKPASKPTQLKKQPSHSKKTISRKTTSRTNKFQNSLKPVSLQQLLKQVKEIRHYTLNQAHSKSKSPLSTHSPSYHKLCPKSLFGTLKHKTNRKTSINISKTLRQLDFTTLFADEQSNLVYPSASDRPIEHAPTPSSDDSDEINLHQMQLLRSAALPGQRLKVDIKSHDSLQQTIAAITIQRAYRKYRTKQLIQRYSQLNCFTLQYGSSRILGHSEDFYGVRKKNQIQQVSDLEQPEQAGEDEQEGEADEYEELVQSLKVEEMEKWDYILGLINNSKGTSFEDTARLFRQIQRQSKINREALLQQTEQQQQKQQYQKQQLQHQPQHKQPLQNIQQPADPQLHTESDSQAQYDCQKYIEQLDSDVFPEAQSSSSSRRIRLALGITTISTRKQQLLLSQLKSVPKLGENVLVSSSSMKYMHTMGRELKQQPNSARSRQMVDRCNSQKAVRRTLSNLSEIDLTDKIDLKLLQDQFLNNYPIIEEQNITAALNSNHQEPIINQQQSLPQDQHKQTKPTKQEDSFTENERQPAHNIIKIEQQQPQSNPQQQVQCNNDNAGLLNISRCVNITAMIIEHLQTELIQEILNSIRLGTFLRQINNRQRKPRVRRAEHNKKKKGFPSDKKEIENFLDNFTNYLLRHHLPSLHNLEISTGPSAMELLKYMHAAEEHSISVNSDEDEGNIMVIPNKVFDLFWKIKQKSIVVEVPPNFTEQHTLVFRQNVEYLKSFNKIFYRVLFDTFNECLDAERNYGILGKPFPWKKTPAFSHKLELTHIQQSLTNAKNKMVEIATTYCGLIVDTEDLNVEAGGEEYLQQVQQDRLSKMLATDLIQNERRWQFYDDEQAEILIEISNALYQELVLQVIEYLIDFQ